MKLYYLFNGKLYWTNIEMPDGNGITIPIAKAGYKTIYKEWLKALQPCEISESELDKVKEYLRSKYDLSPSDTIDVTDIVEEDWNGHCIIFKQPKSEANESSINLAVLHGNFFVDFCDVLKDDTVLMDKLFEWFIPFIEPKSEANESVEWININQTEKPNIGELVEVKDSHGYFYDCIFTNTSTFECDGNLIDSVILWKPKASKSEANEAVDSIKERAYEKACEILNDIEFRSLQDEVKAIESVESYILKQYSKSDKQNKQILEEIERYKKILAQPDWNELEYVVGLENRVQELTNEITKLNAIK